MYKGLKDLTLNYNFFFFEERLSDSKFLLKFYYEHSNFDFSGKFCEIWKFIKDLLLNCNSFFFESFSIFFVYFCYFLQSGAHENNNKNVFAILPASIEELILMARSYIDAIFFIYGFWWAKMANLDSQKLYRCHLFHIWLLMNRNG